MDKILIRNLRIPTILGVNDWERTKLREVVINVTLLTDIHRVSQTDDLTDCLDYSAVVKEIRALVETARRFTVEALTKDVARLCLSQPGVQKVIVRVEKPGAVNGAESVGVEIERKN